MATPSQEVIAAVSKLFPVNPKSASTLSVDLLKRIAFPKYELLNFLNPTANLYVEEESNGGVFTQSKTLETISALQTT